MEIIDQLFVNACIIISIILITGEIFRRYLKTEIIKKFSIGTIGGILIIISMIYSINVRANFGLDFWHISQIVVAIYGGVLSLFITFVISVIFQFFYFGITTYSILTSLGMAIISAGYIYILKSNADKNQRWAYMILYSLIVRSVILLSLLRSEKLIEITLLILWIITLLIGSTVYFLIESLETSNKALKKIREEEEKDPLTGLSNKKNFKKLLNQSVENIIKTRKPISVLVVDIDFFKKVNDTYGYLAGNCILKTLSHILCGACDRFDIIGRIGGQKFSMVLTECSNDKAYEIAECIRAVVEKYPFLLPDGKIIFITVSVGIATYPDTTLELESILKKAYLALYDAKHNGRNRVSSIIRNTIKP